jgi:iron complex outermembrane recepter protein
VVVRTYRRLCGLVVIVVFVAGFAKSGQALQRDASRNRLAALSLEELAHVEVTTADKAPQEISQTPAAVYVITQDEIRRSGVTSIADALRLAPGVEVGRLSSTTWAVGIRGLQNNFSKTVLVLIDGRSVYTPLFAGVYWDVQDLVLDDIDRIEVIRGAGGTIWGANAVNGVINIVTKNAADTHGALVSLSGGTLDRTIDHIRFGGGNGGNFDYRVYVKGLARGPEFHVDHNNYDEWHQQRSGFRMDLKHGADGFMLEGDLYKGDSPHQIGVNNVTDTVSGGNVVGRWNRTINAASDFYFQGFFDRTIRIGPQLGETRNTIDFDFLHHLKVGARHDFRWGGGLRWSPSRFLQQQPTIDLLPHDETDHVYSGFGQDEIQLNRRLLLTVGSKVQHNNLSGFEIEPSARVLWTPGENRSFWAAVTRAVATPSRIEENFRLSAPISTNPPISLLVAGNSDFKSVAVVSYEAGYRQLVSPDVYVDLAAFSNHYSQLQSFGAIVTSFEATPPPPHTLLTIPYGNAISGSSNGFEIAPSWQTTPWLRLSGSYSLAAVDVRANAPTVDISSTGSVRTYEGSTPRHQFEMRCAMNLSKRFEFDPMYRYSSALPAQGVGAYYTMDARFGWNLNSNLQVSVVGQNLWQPHHNEWGTGDPGQTPVGVRRAAYVKLVWKN